MNLMDYLQSAKVSLFRWEALQYYSSDKESLEFFQTTGGINRERMNGWWQFLALKKQEGVVLQRVRLVSHPMTQYVEMELLIHKESAKFGDEIFVIEKDELEKSSIQLPDFWIVDDKIVLTMKYGESGDWEGFDVVDGDIQKYSDFKSFLLQESKPL